MFYVKRDSNISGIDSYFRGFDSIEQAKREIAKGMEMLTDQLLTSFSSYAVGTDLVLNGEVAINHIRGVGDAGSSQQATWTRCWVISEHNGWKLTDDDGMQYCRQCRSDYPYKFELIQYSLVNPESKEFGVYIDKINIADYLQNEHRYHDLSDILSSFGYDDMEVVQKEFGDLANQVAAECIFESISCSYGAEFVGTEKQCKEYIQKYIAGLLEN